MELVEYQATNEFKFVGYYSSLDKLTGIFMEFIRASWVC